MKRTTNLKTLKEKHGVQTFQLPGWAEGEDFICRLRRPTLYNMAAAGLIPNPLLETVQALFSGNQAEVSAVSLTEQAKVMTRMARYAMVEPTYDELSTAGIGLTDEQLLAIYAFSIGGAKVVEPFCAYVRSATYDNDGAVSGAAE